MTKRMTAEAIIASSNTNEINKKIRRKYSKGVIHLRLAARVDQYPVLGKPSKMATPFASGYNG
jgi:hypothetical protein